MKEQVMTMRLLEGIVASRGEEGDPALWRVALEVILSDLDPQAGMLVELGRCSHWWRPHKARWTAACGFAAPLGYGEGNGWASSNNLPEFDWSVMLGWDGDRWAVARPRSVRTALRIAIPARTTRHAQASVHTLWHIEREKRAVPYGFRKQSDGWVCTAIGHDPDRKNSES
jgi:hypothetical protein